MFRHSFIAIRFKIKQHFCRQRNLFPFLSFSAESWRNSLGDPFRYIFLSLFSRRRTKSQTKGQQEMCRNLICQLFCSSRDFATRERMSSHRHNLLPPSDSLTKFTCNEKFQIYLAAVIEFMERLAWWNVGSWWCARWHLQQRFYAQIKIAKILLTLSFNWKRRNLRKYAESGQLLTWTTSIHVIMKPVAPESVVMTVLEAQWVIPTHHKIQTFQADSIHRKIFSHLHEWRERWVIENGKIQLATNDS